MSKRKYSAPSITVHHLDKTISMAMSSLPDPGDGEPEFPGGATTPPTRIFKQNTFVEANPFESSPFN